MLGRYSPETKQVRSIAQSISVYLGIHHMLECIGIFQRANIAIVRRHPQFKLGSNVNVTWAIVYYKVYG